MKPRNVLNDYKTKRLWGLPKEVVHHLHLVRNRTFKLPCYWDNENMCKFGPTFWKNRPADYEYKFNPAGYRDVDHKQYIGKKVNLCVGDSFTTNIGGPVEHSWPYQLSKYFDIPTINIGIMGLTSYYMKSFYEKMAQHYDVQHTFVLYNMFDDIDTTKVHRGILLTPPDNFESKIKILKEYCWIPSVYWQMAPLWSVPNDQVDVVKKHFPNGHEYQLKTKIDYSQIKINDLLDIDVLQMKYYELAGPSWPSLATICERFLIGQNLTELFSASVDKRLITEFVNDHLTRFSHQLFFTNNDGWHMSKTLNKSLADYFYNQTLTNRI